MYCPFELPEDEYGDMMFERRLAMEGSPSPVPSGHAESRRGSTVADTDGAFSLCSVMLGSAESSLTPCNLQNLDLRQLPHGEGNQVVAVV
jgi:hypothetical protein